MNLEVFGWIGAAGFAVCGIPQAYQSFKDGHTKGLNWGFLGTWSIGEICMLIYILPTGNLPLILNYVGNGICLAVMVWYKVFERKPAQRLNILFTPRSL
jgi:uncharacterized protein with PQ loop repeat